MIDSFCCINLTSSVSECLLCRQILRLLMGKVVIGHAIHNDFKVLGYSHPGSQTRDTSRIPLLNQKAGFPANECASLKRLTKAIFNREIQVRKEFSGRSCRRDLKMSQNELTSDSVLSLVSSDWEEGPFFCGGCQSHYGALQSCGAGVGEAAGLQTTGP